MAKKKPALPSLIALNPITSWSDIRQAFRDLLTHESLGDIPGDRGLPATLALRLRPPALGGAQ
jgi:hypothetical protein